MRLPARRHFLASCCIAAMEEMILTLEKLALKHGQSMQLSILLRWWNMLVAPASGGFHAASRRMALLTQELFCSSDKPQSKFAERRVGKECRSRWSPDH